MRVEGFFRSVYLFPMAISFIATAIIWRWLLDNGAGRDTAGLNKLFAYVGLGFLRSDWHKSDSDLGDRGDRAARPAGRCPGT